MEQSMNDEMCPVGVEALALFSGLGFNDLRAQDQVAEEGAVS
jgi:hypothetical protein